MRPKPAPTGKHDRTQHTRHSTHDATETRRPAANDDDFHVRRGVSAAARALGASFDNPAPIFDTFLLLTQKTLSIAMRTGILHVVASVNEYIYN